MRGGKFMLQLLSGFPDDVLAVRVSGKVTRDEFRSVLVHAAESKLKSHDQLALYYRFASDFAGMSAGAMWEDSKLDIGHWKAWRRIAVISDTGWIRNLARLAALLLRRPVRVFSNAQADAARDWVSVGSGAAG
jgi:SpoIIAA-like